MFIVVEHFEFVCIYRSMTMTRVRAYPNPRERLKEIDCPFLGSYLIHTEKHTVCGFGESLSLDYLLVLNQGQHNKNRLVMNLHLTVASCAEIAEWTMFKAFLKFLIL